MNKNMTNRATCVVLLGLVAQVCGGQPVKVMRGDEQVPVKSTIASMLPGPGPGLKHSAIWYGRGGANLQRDSQGRYFCMGNVAGPNLLTSNDDGKTWQVHELTIDGWGSLIAFHVLPDDTLLALFEPTGAGRRTVYCGKSTDGGKTWRVASMKLDLRPYTHVSGKDANIVVLEDGSLVVALQLWGDESAAVADQAVAYALISDDTGATWRRGGAIAQAARHTRLARTADGSLLACTYNLASNKIMVADSADAGATWTEPRPVDVPEPGLGDLTVLADGSVMLQYLYKYEPGREHVAHGVRAVVSLDHGKTWQGGRYVIAHWGTGGYGGYLPGNLGLGDGRLMTARVTKAGNGLRMQAVTWQPQRSE